MKEYLWTIYKYEIGKVIRRKLFWITALLCLAAVIVTVCAGLYAVYYVEGEPLVSQYEAFRRDQSERKSLSGRKIDEALLQETVDAYSRIPSDTAKYALTEEYEHFARPYRDIFFLIRNWTGMDLPAVQQWQVDASGLYAARKQLLEEQWQYMELRESEKEFWRAKEQQLEMPLTYQYHDGYEAMMKYFLTIGVLMLFFTAICLPNLFADEHARKTDQLVLSSAKGKNPAYWAKILAGITVSLAAALTLSLVTAGLCLGIYGTEGFAMPLQAYCSTGTYSYPITIGQACMISYGILIVTSVLAAVFVMVISEFLRSSVAALALATGMIILGNMVTVPSHYRVAAQLWDWLPVTYLSLWNVFDARTLPLFGRCLVSWQAVPVIYILCSMLLAIGGKYIYRRYQVSGR